MNSNSYFNITGAVISAYRFVGREWRYLFGLGLLPASLSFLTTVFVQYQRPEASLMEEFLWTLPSTALFAWFMFEETRLILFGERVDALPTDAAAAQERRDCLRLSIIIWLLFNMASIIVMLYILWVGGNEAAKTNSMLSAFGMILIGLFFWGVRFSVAHILAAVGYPIKSYIFRVNGVGVSLRLIGLGLMSVLPVVLVLQGLVTAIFGDMTKAGNADFMVIALISCLFSVAATALLNAAGVFALKDMLSRPDRRARGRA